MWPRRIKLDRSLVLYVFHIQNEHFQYFPYGSQRVTLRMKGFTERVFAKYPLI